MRATLAVICLLHSSEFGAFALRLPNQAPTSFRRTSQALRSRQPVAFAPVAVLQQTTGAAFQVYEAAALSSPILTKAWTSGVAYLLGDSLAQRMAGGKFELGRMLRSTTAGFVSHGPQLHFWCLILDRFVNLGSGPWAQRSTLALKILLDQTIFSLYLNAAYCALTEALRRTPPALIWARVRASSWPMLRSSWRFWPAVHAFTYSVVPLHLRVLWVDCIEVVWVAILATLVAAAGQAETGEGDSNTSLPPSAIAEDSIESPAEPLELVLSEQAD